MTTLTPALGKVTTTETKLYLRDKTGSGLALLLPLGLLVIFGSIGMAEPGSEIAPSFLPAMTLGLSAAMASLTVLPTILATYREKGILRRLQTTPAHPSTVLIAQLIINLVATTIVALLVVIISMLAFDVPAAQNWGSFAVSFLLMTSSLMAVGLIVAALAPGAKIASSAGMLLFFPMMFFGGIWTPGDLMPGWAQPIRDVSPMGAGMEGIANAWVGDWPSATGLISMAAITVVGSAIAAKIFRWE